MLLHLRKNIKAATQSVGHTPVVLASPGSRLEMKNCKHHPDLLHQNLYFS